MWFILLLSFYLKEILRIYLSSWREFIQLYIRIIFDGSSKNKIRNKQVWNKKSWKDTICVCIYMCEVRIKKNSRTVFNKWKKFILMFKLINQIKVESYSQSLNKFYYFLLLIFSLFGGEFLTFLRSRLIRFFF